MPDEVNLDTTNPSVYVQQAIKLMNDGKHEEAELQFIEALVNAPKHVDAHYRYGFLLQDMNRCKEAEAHYKLAIKFGPDNALANLYYGSLLHVTKRPQQAEEQYKKAIELNPDNSWPEEFFNAHYYYGILLQDHGRYDEAEKRFIKAIELNPNAAGVYSYYGNLLYYNLGRTNEAEAQYKKAIEKGDESPSTLCAIAEIEAKKDSPNLDLAKQYYEKGLAQLSKNDVWYFRHAYYNLSTIFARLNNLDQTLKYMRYVLQMDMHYRDAFEVEQDFAPFRNDQRWIEFFQDFNESYQDHCEQDATVAPGSPAPDFALNDTSGNSVQLNNFKGKVVVLNVWATWCGYCRREIPDFADLYREYKDRGVVVLGVSTDKKLTPQDVASSASQMGANYPILMTNDAFNQAYTANCSSIPQTYIIGTDGIAKDYICGATTKFILESKVKRHISASGTPSPAIAEQHPTDAQNPVTSTATAQGIKTLDDYAHFMHLIGQGKINEALKEFGLTQNDMNTVTTEWSKKLEDPGLAEEFSKKMQALQD